MDLLNTYPFLDRLKYLKHSEKNHPEGNVYEHTLAAIKVARHHTASPLVEAAIAYRDFGKLYTQSIDSKGIHYNGHEFAGDQDVIAACKELRMSKDEIEIVLYCKHNHMRFHRIPEMKHNKVKDMINHIWFKYLYFVSIADNLCRLDAIDIDGHMKIDKIIKEYLCITDQQAILKIIDTPLFAKEIFKIIGESSKNIGVVKADTKTFISDYVVDNFINQEWCYMNFTDISKVDFVTPFGIYTISDDFIPISNMRKTSGLYPLVYKTGDKIYYNKFEVMGLTFCTQRINWYEKIIIYMIDILEETYGSVDSFNAE